MHTNASGSSAKLKWWSCPFSKGEIKQSRIGFHVFFLLHAPLWPLGSEGIVPKRTWHLEADSPGVEFWLSPACGSGPPCPHLSNTEERTAPGRGRRWHPGLQAGQGYLANTASLCPRSCSGTPQLARLRCHHGESTRRGGPNGRHLATALATAPRAGRPGARCWRGGLPWRPLPWACGWPSPPVSSQLFPLRVCSPYLFGEKSRHRGLEHTLRASFSFHPVSKAPSPNTVKVWGAKGQAFNIGIWGDTVQLIRGPDCEAAHGTLLSPVHSFWGLLSGQSNRNWLKRSQEVGLFGYDCLARSRLIRSNNTTPPLYFLFSFQSLGYGLKPLLPGLRNAWVGLINPRILTSSFLFLIIT